MYMFVCVNVTVDVSYIYFDTAKQEKPNPKKESSNDDQIDTHCFYLLCNIADSF